MARSLWELRGRGGVGRGGAARRGVGQGGAVRFGLGQGGVRCESRAIRPVAPGEALGAGLLCCYFRAPQA